MQRMSCGEAAGGSSLDAPLYGIVRMGGSIWTLAPGALHRVQAGGCLFFSHNELGFTLLCGTFTAARLPRADCSHFQFLFWLRYFGWSDVLKGPLTFLPLLGLLLVPIYRRVPSDSLPVGIAKNGGAFWIGFKLSALLPQKI